MSSTALITVGLATTAAGLTYIAWLFVQIKREFQDDPIVTDTLHEALQASKLPLDQIHIANTSHPTILGKVCAEVLPLVNGRPFATAREVLSRRLEDRMQSAQAPLLSLHVIYRVSTLVGMIFTLAMLAAIDHSQGLKSIAPTLACTGMGVLLAIIAAVVETNLTAMVDEKKRFWRSLVDQFALAVSRGEALPTRP